MTLPERFSPVKITQGMLFLSAILWVGLALFTAIRMQNAAGWILGGLMAANAAAFAWCGFAVRKRSRLTDGGIMLVLAVNAVLSITDQVGPADVAALVLNLALIGLMLVIIKKGLPVK